MGTIIDTFFASLKILKISIPKIQSILKMILYLKNAILCLIIDNFKTTFNKF